MAAPERWPEIKAPVVSSRLGVEPLGVGVIGPPGSGKTRSVLRLMEGVRRVRKGPVVLIDTEGRSRKFSPKPGEKADPSKGTYDFERIDLGPPYRSDRCLEAIRIALKRNPCAVGFDTLSDEHDGEGGYLEWHQSILEIPKGQPGYVGDNSWAAWSQPSAARKRLTTALLHIDTPLFFTFRAAEKTAQEGKKIVKLGWMPIAPLLIVKSLDLTCILPYDSKGTPVWKMQGLAGEDFIRKWPEYLLNIISAGQLTEDTGEALARWAMGESVAPATASAATAAVISKDEALAEALSTLQRLPTKEERAQAMALHFGGATGWSGVKALDLAAIQAGTASLARELDGLKAMRADHEPASLFDNPPAERQPGEDDEEGGTSNGNV